MLLQKSDILYTSLKHNTAFIEPLERGFPKCLQQNSIYHGNRKEQQDNWARTIDT